MLDRPDDSPDILIGFPGLRSLGVNLNCRTGKWWFDAAWTETPTDFSKEILKSKGSLMVAFVSPALGNEEKSRNNRVEVHRDVNEVVATLPPELHEFRELFSEQKAKEQPKLPGAVHTINTKEGAQVPYRGIYHLNPAQSRILHEYIEENLRNGRIRHSESPGGAPVLFVPKSDGTLRLCVDYRGLNKITTKNRYPLPLVGELLATLAEGCVFSKLDARDAYHRISVADSDQWKTAFRTKYGHYEYTVMPFGLTNAPATFQNYIHQALAGLVDVCCVVYLDDIIVFSKNKEDHMRDLASVMHRLLNAELFLKLSKCRFFQTRIDFLGFIITADGIEMDPARVDAVSDWAEPKCYRDIQVFLGFANFYRKFIQGYSSITSALTALLKGSVNGKKKGQFIWPPDAAEAFAKLKTAFKSAPLLRHFEFGRLTRVETDASQVGVGGILSQQIDGQWYPVAFWSRKLTETEQRWQTGHQELLAIIEAVEHWRQFLEGGEPFVVLTDHQALKGVVQADARDLRGRLARWVYRLSSFDFELEHRPGATNPADPLSRKPEYEEGEVSHRGIAEDLATKLNLEPPLVQVCWLDLVPTIRKKAHLADELPPEFREKARTALPRATRAVQSIQTAQSHCSRDRSSAQDQGGQPCRCTAHRMRPLAGAVTIAAMTRGEAAKRRRGTRSATMDPSSGAAASRNVAADALAENPDEAGILLGQNQRLPRSVARELAQNETAWSPDLSSEFRTRTARLQKADVPCRILIDELKKGDAGIIGGGYHLAATDRALLYKDRIVIPNEGTLRDELLHAHHDDPRAGHMGGNRTSELMRRKFHWEGMDTAIQEYVRTCSTCQGSRKPRHKPYGKLQSLPLPDRPFQEITVDFITGLPSAEGLDGRTYDAILVFTDRYTKMVLMIPTVKTLRAPDFASLLYEHIECRFGTPEGIVSDRDKLFTSTFWAEFCRVRAIRRRLSTAWHPQTDGANERSHSDINRMLRGLQNETGDANRWLRELKSSEFAINNGVNRSIGVCPFEALYGYHPRFVDYIGNNAPDLTKSHGVLERLVIMRRCRKRMQGHWERAVEGQQRYYNTRHTEQVFKEGDWVGLSTKNFRFKGPGARKLAPTAIKVRITEVIGKQAYRVELPERYDRMYPVFHVALLEPWLTRDGQPADQPESDLPELEDEPEEWEVEDIITHESELDREKHYLVKWKGWPVEYNTWEPEAHFANASQIVRRYNRQAKKSHKKWDD